MPIESLQESTVESATAELVERWDSMQDAEIAELSIDQLGWAWAHLNRDQRLRIPGITEWDVMSEAEGRAELQRTKLKPWDQRDPEGLNDPEFCGAFPAGGPRHSSKYAAILSVTDHFRMDRLMELLDEFEAQGVEA